jgi:uncharacterized membrane protein
LKVPRTDRALHVLLLLYLVASFVHFTHNAEYVHHYPNLPPWISRAGVYVAWLGITAVGALGYWLYRRWHPLTGLVVLGAYAAQGFDGLLHYTRAPFRAHDAAMNFTILFETISASILLAMVLVLCSRRRASRRLVS